MNCRLQQSKRNYKVTPPWSNRSPQNFHVSQILNDVATTRDSGSRKGIWNFNQDSWHCKLLLLRPWDPNKDIHVGNPCSCCLHWKLFLTHTNNSPGRRAVTREWRHGQEPPQTNLTGQNNLLRRRAQWKQVEWLKQLNTHRIRYAISRKQGPHLSNLHSKHKGSAGSADFELWFYRS